jgi:tetratricopeptide (TPR) repeat protein
MMREDRLNSLLLAWQEQQLRGRDVSAAELCRDCPELAEELSQRIGVLRRMNELGQPGGTPAGPCARDAARGPGTGGWQTGSHTVPADRAGDADGRQPMTQPPRHTPDPPRPAPGGSEDRPQTGERQTIGRFRLEKLLGEGGFAQVYLAYDPALDRKVAIKVPRQASGRADILRREALVAAKLKHPGIVPIYEICPSSSSVPQLSSDPAVYVVMQFIEGTNLAQKLEAGKVSLDYAVDLMLDVSEALAFAHGQGVLHRDLKPHNILLDVNDRPYVADFGLAVRQETLSQHLGEGCGTPAYMSPEQAAGGSLTPASDIWSMGVILYELLVGQRPFGSHPLEVLRRLGKEDPVAPRQLDSAVPPVLEQICLKCLARTPGDRYPSARELIADLRQWKTYRAAGPGEDELQKAEQSYKQAFASMDSGELTTALGRLQDAVRLNPDAASAYYLLGLCYLMTDHNAQLAVPPLTRAVELNRENDAANFVLANVYYEVKAYHLAATFADQALAAKPSNQSYRAFQKKVRDRLGSASSGDAVKSKDIKYDLDPPRRRHLSEVAEAIFHLEKTRQLSLFHWTALHYPWRLIRRRPLLGSVTITLVLYGLALALHLLSGDATRTVRLALVCVGAGLALYLPFLLPRLLEQTYVRLLPAVNMPEDAFRRFFIRQSAYILGGTCGLRDSEHHSGFKLSWQYNRPHLLIAALAFPPLLILQLFCANDPFWPITWARLGLFAAGILETYALVWLIPLAVLLVFFIPRFYNVPVRYFLGMPAELSLGAVGSFYVSLGWFACAGHFFFLAQHYVWRTYQTVPVASVLFVLVGICWIISIVIMTQYQLYRLLGRLKARKILEYSYHVEGAFERVMKKPTEQGFAELAAHQQFMKSLHGLSARGLSREDLLNFLLIVAVLLGLTAVYGYLVMSDIWLI